VTHSKLIKSIFYGPTGSHRDKLGELEFPILAEGDMLYFPENGCYTYDQAMTFHGFKTKVIEIEKESEFDVVSYARKY